MSINVVRAVLEILGMDSTKKFVLVVMAEHADKHGRESYPAVKTIARETGLSERTVQYTLRDLERSGHLVPYGKGRRGTTKYSVFPNPDARFAPASAVRGASETGTGASDNVQGCNSFAPDPSLEPSLEPSFTTHREMAVDAWKEHYGNVTRREAVALRQMEDYCFDRGRRDLMPLAIAVVADKPNIRDPLTYLQGIVRSHVADGTVPSQPAYAPRGHQDGAQGPVTPKGASGYLSGDAASLAAQEARMRVSLRHEPETFASRMRFLYGEDWNRTHPDLDGALKPEETET